MKLVIDTDNRKLTQDEHGELRVFDLYSDDAFAIISRQWVKVGWNQKYEYSFTWMGRPIIQLPEDMIRAQEVIYRLKPDTIVETGVAHGGSLIFYAGLCKLMGKGRVIGVDVEIRPHNRRAIESHELFSWVTLIEGSSTDPKVVDLVSSEIATSRTVLVLLDSNHSRKHVLNELNVYQRFVTPGSYIVATDGVMEDLYDVPRGKPAWTDDNPRSAIRDFLQNHAGFVEEQPTWPFNESTLTKNITHWPGAWLRRVSEASRDQP